MLTFELSGTVQLEGDEMGQVAREDDEGAKRMIGSDRDD
jgi:hypothetical protein